MKIIIGNVYSGMVKSYNGQYIASKLFFLGLPLFPVSSFLVVKRDLFKGREGIEIPNYTPSIVAGLLRFWIIPLAAIVYNIITSYTDNINFVFAHPTYTGEGVYFGTWIITSILFIYLWFIYGRSTKKEKFARRQFGSVLGIYLMPEWLDYYDLRRFQKTTLEQFETHFGDADWEKRLETIKVDDADFSLIYCTSYMTIQLNSLDDKKTLLDKKYEEYLITLNKN